MLLGLVLSAFGAGNLQSVRAEAASVSVENSMALDFLPSNDDFNTPESVSGLPYEITQDNSTATTALDDPVFPCGSFNQGSNSVWYSFTPTENVTISVTASISVGDGTDTLLAIWSGTRGDLTNVACNDDALIGIGSEISATLQAGVPYFIEFAGFVANPAIPAKVIQSEAPIPSTSSGVFTLSVDFGCPGEPNDPMITTRDNQNNTGTGDRDCDMDTYLYNDSLIQPIEFTIDVPSISGITSAELLLLNWDVDENSGEVDNVYFNEHLAGSLVGANDTWSTTALTIDPTWVVAGNNLVRIEIDTTNITRAVTTDWGQLVFNDQEGTATIRTALLDKSIYSPGDIVHTNVEIDTSLTTQDVRTEINLRNASGQILDGTSVNHTLSGTSDDSISVDLIIPTGVPVGTYNIQVLVYDLASSIIQDAQVIPFTVKNPSMIFYSIGTGDGWILESTETSRIGGTANSTAPTFNLGDDAQDKQYLSILHFNTAALPENAVIVKVTLRIKKQGLVGTNPFGTHSWLKADIRKLFFGSSASLVPSDFQAPAHVPAVGTFRTTPVSNWYIAAIGSTGYPYINKAGTTQFRLRFLKDDNDDKSADYMIFYSGNYPTVGARPILVVEYSIP
jgi:hypothetical protein